MQDPPTTSGVLRFGVFELDLRAGELRKQGLRVRLQEQAFQVLAALLENAGKIVTREDLRRRLWPENTVVDFDHSLNNSINKLRHTLGDSADSPRFIETLARRGYRFIAAVEPMAAPGPIAEQTSGARPEPPAGAVSRGRAPRWFLAIASTVIGLVAALAVWNPAEWRNKLRGRGDFGSLQSLAVLPLENLSGDPAQEYLADSMTDQLITGLAGIRALRVISRSSVMRYKGTHKPLREISRDLKVDAVVEGSVLRSGSRLCIAAQFVHAGSDRILWAETYEGELGEILTFQAEAALSIARKIQVQVTPQDEARLASRRPVDAEAQDAYFRGRYYWNTKKTKEGLEKAIVFFQQALAKEPHYAQAYSGLADTYVLLGSRGFLPPKEAYSRAKTAAIQALSLDNTLAEAHTAPAFAALYYDWQWADAERGFRRAVELNPSYTNAHHWYSHFLIAMGRTEESLRESRRCLELDPLDPAMAVHLGEHYFYARQYDRAIEQLLKSIEMDASRYRAHDRLGRAYEQKRQHAQALAEFEKAVATSQEGGAALASLAAGYAAAGKRNDAMRLVGRLKLLAGREYVPAYGLAEVYAALGDKEQAFAWLERAYEERSSELVYLKVEPRLDGLRSDLRFQHLLRRMRLGP
jgi:TolB-like protein/DNA-binding winged helix-turn-helix (wHTH) protein/Flp pilus assembly protein TadD